MARVGPQGWPKRGMKSYAALVMSRSEPEGAPEGSQPPEGRAPQGTHTDTDTFILYKTATPSKGAHSLAADLLSSASYSRLLL